MLKHWTSGMRPPKFKKVRTGEQYKVGINAKSVNVLIEIADKMCDFCRMKRLEGKPVPLSCDVCRKGKAIANAKLAVKKYNETQKEKRALIKAEAEKFHEELIEIEDHKNEGRPTRW